MNDPSSPRNLSRTDMNNYGNDENDDEKSPHVKLTDPLVTSSDEIETRTIRVPGMKKKKKVNKVEKEVLKIEKEEPKNAKTNESLENKSESEILNKNEECCDDKKPCYVDDDSNDEIISFLMKTTSQSKEICQNAFENFNDQDDMNVRVKKTIGYLFTPKEEDEDEVLPTKTIKIPKKRVSKTTKKSEVSSIQETKDKNKDRIDAAMAIFNEQFPSISSKKFKGNVNTRWHYAPSNVQISSNPKSSKPNPVDDKKVKIPTSNPTDAKKAKTVNSKLESATNEKSKMPVIEFKQKNQPSKQPKNCKKRDFDDEPGMYNRGKPQNKRRGQKTKKNTEFKGRNHVIPESVSFTTFIVIDMHGSDPKIKKPLDWVTVIRDALFDALEHKVDSVNFITGKGIHSQNKKPFLRPLVLLTSKRLGFESKINEENAGIVNVDVSSYQEPLPGDGELEDEDAYNELFQTFRVGKLTGCNIDDDDDDDDDDSFWRDDDDDDTPYQAVKKSFPSMQDVCIKIICENRDKKEALRFARKFEEQLEKDDLYGSIRKSTIKLTKEEEEEMRKRNEQKKKENRLIKEFLDTYKLDREIIERVVHDKKKRKKSKMILDQIKKIPEDFLLYLPELFENYKLVPIESLLNTAEENDYDIDNVVNKLISQSMMAMQDALDVLKVSRKIQTERPDGTSKFIHSIEIDLSNSGVKKAEVTIQRIMNGMSEESFSEMVLYFSPKPKRCTLKDLLPFLNEKAEELQNEGIRIKRKNNARKYRYYITIINDDNDDVEIEEEEDDIDSYYDYDD
ncbi:hypothetical protein M9Y10_011973 [Tritrichomonas musculus]|uniref:Smr domain-containing protein n=1 Tax=Tritrichomonas musculus TaxID=1915356 RepID=A0ABR2IBC4_9EUKA